MNKVLDGLFAAILVFLVSASVSAEEVGATVLVLGTKSPVISDVQDRVLRESVMRELLAAGMKIVPVMELERGIQLDGLDVRDFPSSKIASLTEKFAARFCVRGSFGGTTKSGVYALVIDDAAEGKRYAADIPLLRGESFQSQCSALAKKIAEKVREAASGTR